MPDQINSEELQSAADFGARMIPLLLKIREAKDQRTSVTLIPAEVTTLVELLNILRGGRDQL